MKKLIKLIAVVLTVALVASVAVSLVACKDKETLIGYDIDLAKAVFKDLGLNVEFVKINWNTKETELQSKTIDLIWNGMTINEAMILCCLKDGEAKTAGALSEFVGLSNSRISKVINAVEGKQLIRRLINPNDKRQMLFSLTPEGRACIATMQGKDLGFDNFFTNLRKCLG